MKSLYLYTDELDDMVDAADELLEQFEEKKSEENFSGRAVGLLIADPEIEIEELMGELGNRFDFPVLAWSALGVMDNVHGYFQEQISLMILSDEDLEFSFAVTDEIQDIEKLQKEIQAIQAHDSKDSDTALPQDSLTLAVQKAYREAEAKLGSKPDLVLCYATYLADVPSDIILRGLDGISGGVPIFGGVASDMFNFESGYIAMNEEVRKQGVAILLLKGANISPVYRVELSLLNDSFMTAQVTESKSNVISEVNGHPALQVLDDKGISKVIEPDDDIQLSLFTTPFHFTAMTEDGHTYSFLRNLMRFDHQKKTMIFLGEIPDGSIMRIGAMDAIQIKKHVRTAVQGVVDKIKSSNPQCSAVLVVSCASRYMNLKRGKDEEAEAAIEALPKGMNYMGFYSYGEFCPVQDDEEKFLKNTFHNFTFTIMAI